MNLPWKRLNSTGNWDRSFITPVQHLVDDFFNDFSPLWSVERPMQSFRPKVNISETDTQYKISAELPGMEEKDFEVLLEENILRIKGEKTTTEEHKEGSYARQESSYGSFERAFELPSEVDAEKIDAKFKNGVLNITLNKVSSNKKTKKIQIESH